MTDVIFRKARYEDASLRSIIFEMMDALGNGLFSKGSRILIKPNLLLPARPDKAITTHPLIVRAVAEYVLEAGGTVQISDSPAMGSFDRLLKEGRYAELLSDLDVAWTPFGDSIKTDIGKPFGAIEIAKDALEADGVINLAKLKTHSQMLLTLGVKNLFGCIVGYRKPEWHLRAGIDRALFANLLARIYATVGPSLTIIDGVLALEGQGPGKSGTPKRLEVLIGSRNAAASDMAVCRMLGIHPNRLPTHVAASSLGLVTEEAIALSGHMPRVERFNLPVLAPLTFGPRRFQNLIRKHLLQRPVVDPERCKRCGECWQYCPAHAIAPDALKIRFDYAGCIRCYCCIEVCPHGALRSEETISGRLIRKIPFFSD